MRRNRLRELLRAGQPSVGTHLHSAWPVCMGWDVSILFDWFKSEGRALRDALGGG